MLPKQARGTLFTKPFSQPDAPDSRSAADSFNISFPGPLTCTHSKCMAPDIPDLVAATWKGKSLAPGETVEYMTCRDGRKADPDWAQNNASLFCNANLEWQVTDASYASYSCVATSYCPAAEDGPASDQGGNSIA